MSWCFSSIGNHVEKISTWNPCQSLDSDAFRYIDLSSVDKDKKVISQTDVLLINPTEAPSRARQLVKTKDVLVATVRPNLNGVAIVPDEFEGATASTGYCVLRADNSTLDSRYLYYWVRTDSFVKDMVAKATGANYPAVSDKIIKESKIPLPPLAEQKRIAAILDKADSLRRKRQQAIQLADQFLRAVFLDMFGDPVMNPKGWQISTFGEIFDVRDGTHDSPKYLHTGYPLITSKNIKNGMLDLRDVNYISQADYDSINKRSKVDVGDVLMPMIGTIGNPVIVNFEPNFAIKNVALIKTNNSKIPPEIVKMLLDGPLLKHAITSLGRGGTQKFLSLGDIRQLKCFIPDTEVIDKFLLINNKTQKLVGKYLVHNKSNIFESLSQKAFAGEL